MQNAKSISGFTLIELLVVIAIAASMVAASGPVISGLCGAKSVTRVASDLADTLQMARTYAMANHTYVRVGFAKVTPANSGLGAEATVVLLFYSADGTLSQGSASDMADATKWPTLQKPLLLYQFVSSEVEGTSPSTTNDAQPSASDIGPVPGRRVGSLSSTPSFDSFIQFSPEGEARVMTDTPARQIKIAMDRSTGKAGRDPFILRLSCANGMIQLLLKGNGI